MDAPVSEMPDPHFTVPDHANERSRMLATLLNFSPAPMMSSSKSNFYLKMQKFVSALVIEMERVRAIAFASESMEKESLKRKQYKYKYYVLENMRDACIKMAEALLDKEIKIVSAPSTIIDKTYPREKKKAAIKNFANETQGSWIKISLKILAIGVITAACAFLGFMVGAVLSFGAAGVPGAVIGLKAGLGAITALTLTESVSAGVGGVAGLMASTIGFFYRDERQIKARDAIQAANKYLYSVAAIQEATKHVSS